jgi:multidrug efflux system membrane fusion protein
MSRGLGLCWAMLFAAACRGSHAGTDEVVVAAATAPARVESFAEVTSAVGTVVPRPGHFVALGAPAPTRVARIYVAVGAAVRQGDSLVAFERAPFDAQAQSAEAALSAAQHAYERAERLTQAGVLPRKELDLAAVELAQARANAVSARRAQELATLRAPISGVVTAMRAVLGAPADAGQVLVEIADPAALDVVLDLAPAEAARVSPGAKVTLTAGQAEKGEPLAEGLVAEIAGAVDSTSRSVGVRVRVGRTVRQLRVGETVAGTIILGVRPRTVTVPVAALVPAGEGYQVFVVDEAGIARARPVTVGGRNGGRAEILAGLRGGETVVTDGAYGVQDGARISPKTP